MKIEDIIAVCLSSIAIGISIWTITTSVVTLRKHRTWTHR